MPHSISISTEAIEVDGCAIRQPPDVAALAKILGSDYRTTGDSTVSRWIWDEDGVIATSTVPASTMVANLGVMLRATHHEDSPKNSYIGNLAVCGIKPDANESARSYVRRLFSSLHKDLQFIPGYPHVLQGQIRHVSKKTPNQTARIELADAGSADDSLSEIGIHFYFSTPGGYNQEDVVQEPNWGPEALQAAIHHIEQLMGTDLSIYAKQLDSRKFQSEARRIEARFLEVIRSGACRGLTDIQVAEALAYVIAKFPTEGHRTSSALPALEHEMIAYPVKVNGAKTFIRLTKWNETKEMCLTHLLAVLGKASAPIAQKNADSAVALSNTKLAKPEPTNPATSAASPPTSVRQSRMVTIERTSKWIKFFMVLFGLGFPLCIIGAFAFSGFAQTLSIFGIFFCPVAFLVTRGPIRWWFHG